MVSQTYPAKDFLYFAQAFHHGEPEHRSYVIAVGSLDVVDRLARAERDQHPDHGVAVYRVTIDQPASDHIHLIYYHSSEMGEKWTDRHGTNLKHSILE